MAGLLKAPSEGRRRPQPTPDSKLWKTRRLALGLLVMLVVGVHGCVGREVANAMAELSSAPSSAPRIEVAFVREMALGAPPPAALAAAPRAAAGPSFHRPKPKRIVPAQPASAPAPESAEAAAAAVPDPADAAASKPLVEASGVAAGPAEPAMAEAATNAASGPDIAGSAPGSESPNVAAAPASTAASGPAPAAFEWPVSTRVSYLLTGYYRGEVSGSAQCEWIRIGSHYQVHLDLLVGPSFAPVITRRMTSDGEITADGLAPRRYDQDTRVMGIDRSPVTLRFEGDSVVLANGDRAPSRPGLQDTASQFVQLSYVFATRPELLRIGGTVDIPLALPHKVDVWTYDVVAEETLQTPFGEITAIHLKPRRKSERSDELAAEIWFAPQLRYLPARIRIQQGAESHLDLMIDRRPNLAGPPDEGK